MKPFQVQALGPYTLVTEETGKAELRFCVEEAANPLQVALPLAENAWELLECKDGKHAGKIYVASEGMKPLWCHKLFNEDEIEAARGKRLSLEVAAGKEGQQNLADRAAAVSPKDTALPPSSESAKAKEEQQKSETGQHSKSDSRDPPRKGGPKPCIDIDQEVPEEVVLPE